MSIRINPIRTYLEGSSLNLARELKIHRFPIAGFRCSIPAIVEGAVYEIELPERLWYPVNRFCSSVDWLITHSTMPLLYLRHLCIKSYVAHEQVFEWHCAYNVVIDDFMNHTRSPILDLPNSRKDDLGFSVDNMNSLGHRSFVYGESEFTYLTGQSIQSIS